MIAPVAQPVPGAYNAFVYVADGAGLFGAEGKRAGDGQMVMFAQDGDEVRIANPADAVATLEVLLIAACIAHRISDERIKCAGERVRLSLPRKANPSSPRMRIVKFLALRWRDVDLYAKKIAVRHSLL